MSDLFLASYAALWILVAVQTLLLIGLTRALYELRGELSEGSSFVGRPVPRFSAVDLSGVEVSSESIAGRAAVLLFVSPDCPSCSVTLAELKPLVKDKTRSLVVVCDGEDAECRRIADEFGVNGPVVVDEEGELKRLFGISGTPMGVRISAQGAIESIGEPARGGLLKQLLADIGEEELQPEPAVDKAAV